MQLKTADIRKNFVRLLAEEKFTQIDREATMTGLVGNTTIEIVGASFIADEESIFGDVNWNYVEREEEWYNSMSLNVNDIPGGAPKIWSAVADPEGFINSNYGWCIFSPQNGFSKSPDPEGWMNQYKSAFQELRQSPSSRRACMIYTRPSMWLDYNKNGRSDFMCTNVVQYLVRDGAVHAVVQMRSNDGWAGYRNDRAWQQHVLTKLTADLNREGYNYKVGDLHWCVGSLHVYAKDYYLIDHCAKTGEKSIPRAKYKELYPESKYC
jgi:thymidylate synthase